MCILPMSDITDYPNIQIEAKTIWFHCHQMKTTITFCTFEVIIVLIWSATFYLSSLKMMTC